MMKYIQYQKSVLAIRQPDLGLDLISAHCHECNNCLADINISKNQNDTCPREDYQARQACTEGKHHYPEQRSFPAYCDRQPVLQSDITVWIPNPLPLGCSEGALASLQP